jgi:4-carboxymuconolactone decarboxylase
MTHPRIAPLTPPYPTTIGNTFAQIMPPGIEPLTLFRTIAHNERLLRKLHLGNLLDRGAVDRREREIVILRTCARCTCEYEWGVHVAFFAQKVGLSDAKVSATLGDTAELGVWSATEALLIQLVDELYETNRLSDALWQRLTQHWQTVQLLELIALVGFYHMIAFLVNSTALALEPWAARFPENTGSSRSIGTTAEPNRCSTIASKDISSSVIVAATAVGLGSA